MKRVMKTVAILCARADSDYKTIPACDVYDVARDARTFAGGMPVVAHPPCRLWGRLRSFAKCENPETEKALGLWCIAQVREHGGVLEHPISSTLWNAGNLPRPGERDSFGGFTVAMPQNWFGHRAEKWSWFYVVGIEPKDLPEIPFVIGEAERTIGLWSGRSRDRCRRSVTKRERDATPPQLAAWLIETARRCAAVTA